MPKRAREEDHDGAKPPKRSKPEDNRQPKNINEILSVRQLQQILAFRQDGIQELLDGIGSFKAFLGHILYSQDDQSRPRQLSILREYLDSEKPADDDDPDRPFLRQLWQAWSFAGQNNNEHVVSSVSSILTLLLKVLSSLLDFRVHGLLLCRTTLQQQHLRLIKRALDAPKHKAFVISPSFRLLTEVTSFDGGVLAREVYRHGEQTFDIACLRRNLAIVKTDVSQEEAHKWPSIRTLTIRYVLSHIKYQQEGGKIEILQNRPLWISLLHYLQDDPADVVNELLNITEQYILKDDDLPRSAKATLLTQHNLERVAEVATRSADDHAAAERALQWLKAVCTRPAYGVLRLSGWYPPGTTTPPESQDVLPDAIDLGLDSLEFYDRSNRPDVRNTTLLGWLKTLRPHANHRERELAITCFKAAPELVAAYFAEKNIQFEPKLSNTWIGYASFLFEVLSLSIPENLGNVDGDGFAQLPPQTTILLENLLPKPLTQKILTRCLNQSSELVTIFTARLLIIAFGKLKDMLRRLRQAVDGFAEHAALWHEASDRLSSRLVERAPNIKDVINTFRKIPNNDEHALQREATLRLLRLYHEVTPAPALEEQFDVSSALSSALERGASNQDRSELRELRALELEHLLVIASQSVGMRWFSKQGSLTYSPLGSLLKLHLRDVQNRQIRRLLVHVLSDFSIVSNDVAVEALLASLLHAPQDAHELWTFIDECLARVSRQPVKYVDYVESIGLRHSPSSRYTYGEEDSKPDLLAAVACEQAPFVAKKLDIMSWINGFLDLLRHAHMSATLEALREEISALAGPNQLSAGFNTQELLQRVHQKPEKIVVEFQSGSTIAKTPVLAFVPPPAETEDHPELLRWARKGLDLAVAEGDISALILCLCSQYHDVRTQAHLQLKSLRSKLQTSTLESKDQTTVLIGELVETYEQQYVPEAKALPYLAGTFAIHALRVLQEPTHCIYSKLNRYLIRSPEWRITRLPSHWLSSIFLSLPDDDDAYWIETQWVLNWLGDGLRTPADVEMLRKGGVFEKVMSLYSSPTASAKVAKERVMELLFKATCIEGGSNVLMTRCGVIAWLDMAKTSKEDTAVLLKRRILETCDHGRIEQWSGIPLEQM